MPILKQYYLCGTKNATFALHVYQNMKSSDGFPIYDYFKIKG